MTYIFALTMGALLVLSCLAGAALSWRFAAWLVSEVRTSLATEQSRSDFANLSAKMVEAMEEQTRRLEKLDISVGNLVMRSITQTTKVKERQVGETDDLTWPDPRATERKMYRDGLVEVEGKKAPPGAISEANVRALGKPT